MHGVRRQLIRHQAASLDLPVDFVVIPHHPDPPCPIPHQSGPGTTFPPNDTYTPTMLEAFGRFRGEGIEVIVFGDIFLEDLRAFRDRLLGQAGLAGSYPLWGRDTNDLYDEFVATGFRAVTVCVDAKRLSPDHCGQFLTAEFRKSLPEGVDPCGENGEYHSFAFDGPPFRRPVAFRPGGLHVQEPFVFQELFPGDETSRGTGATGPGVTTGCRA
jgi:diphthamide synthase (EF-2-diphthine--ammonia ligase)